MENKWISVNDQLPKRNTETVIVLGANGCVYCGYYSPVENHWYVFNRIREIVQKNVVAWMPMPLPPTQE